VYPRVLLQGTQHLQGRPVTGQLCRPGRGEYEHGAAWAVPREPQQHLPHCVVAAVYVVEDQDDRPVNTGLGEQTGYPLDDVVAKSLRARRCVMSDAGMAGEWGQATKPTPADAADSISFCVIF
jgi:hypothetical protein